MKIKKGAFALIILSVVSFVFVCISTGGNSWVQKEILGQHGIYKTKRGLWKQCSSILDECTSYTVTSDYLLACRALAIIASIISFGGVMLSIAGHSWHVKPRMLKGVATLIFLVKPYVLSVVVMGAAVVMFIVNIVYISKNVWISQPGTNYGLSFVLSWISIASHCITASVNLLLARYNVE